MVRFLMIGNKKVGNNEPAFIVAEMSANHNQDYRIAVKTIRAAKEAGADAIKLQTYTPDTLTINCKNKYFMINQGTIWDGWNLYDLYKEAYTPWEWQPKLKKLAEELGLIFFSSAFDKTAVDFLEKMNVPAHKIASFEITDTSLIEYMASKKKPIIISTGIAGISDINEAIKACKRAGNNEIILLKCTSAYPAPLNEINLKTIIDMNKRFKAIVGISDHTLGISVPIAAVALGAKVIEKHFVLDRKLKSPDSGFSLEPNEFKNMVNSIREVEKALGEVTYTLTESMKKGRELSRSLFFVEDIRKGELLTKKCVRSIRPGYGLHPKNISKVIGKRAKQDIKKGTPASWSLIT